MKNLNVVIFFAITCMSVISLFPSYALDKESTSSISPKDLLYNGKPITRNCIESLAFGNKMGPVDELDLSECSNKGGLIEEGELAWSYKGTLPNGLHVLYVYLWPGAMGKYSEILFVKRQENALKVAKAIEGGDRHSTMIFEDTITVSKNIVSYEQGVAYGTFAELPYEVEDFNIGACIGEACYMGSSRWELMFQTNGNVERKFISFSLASTFDPTNPKDKENSCKEILSETDRKDLSNLQALQTVFMRSECKGITEFNAATLKEIVLQAKSMADPNKENVY